ncbi:hypothetical protein F4859DRAFT_113010 [Xylaria cf. heliscus]|nr:hypothetical protein F4859DRAFT_113010 [Xylaria cf. heliscus]
MLSYICSPLFIIQYIQETPTSSLLFGFTDRDMNYTRHLRVSGNEICLVTYHPHHSLVRRLEPSGGVKLECVTVISQRRPRTGGRPHDNLWAAIHLCLHLQWNLTCVPISNLSTWCDNMHMGHRYYCVVDKASLRLTRWRTTCMSLPLIMASKTPREENEVAKETAYFIRRSCETPRIEALGATMCGSRSASHGYGFQSLID